MPLAAITKEGFEVHLRELGLSRGSNIVVHSRLISFGPIEGGVNTAYEALRKIVGDLGTIAVPTYTFHLDETTPYDPATTPSRAVGVLSEYVRKLPGAERGRCPLHSHAAVGPKASVVADANPACSFGAGSSFEALHQTGFSLVLLGCTFQEGAAFVHHVEAMRGVPYREWLELPRRIRREGGAVESLYCHYYGRKPDAPWITDLQSVEETVKRDGVGRRVSIGARASYLVPLVALEDCVFSMLGRNSYSLMRPKQNPARSCEKCSADLSLTAA